MRSELSALRHSLHQHPELAFQEHRTKAILLDHLRGIFASGKPASASSRPVYKLHEFKNSPGILLEYRAKDGPFRLFRADMDALPLIENTACDFISQTPGMMHACGHDIHMTVLMGLIETVFRNNLSQNLLFLFQPAEEGQGGAESILAEGILQSFDIDSVIALHVGSDMPVGSVASRPGIFFGIPQEFDVEFKGRASHVAFPEKGVNAIAAGLDFMQRMQSDIERLARDHRVIFHVGKINGGTIRNVIADRCVLEGTHRSLEKEARDEMNRIIVKNGDEAARAIGAECETRFLCSYDPVINAPSLVNELREKCSRLGINYETAPVVMTGEDFGFFTSLYPGLLFWLGSGCEHPLHSGLFLPDEACIETGVKLLYSMAASR
jgi:N-acetyldiaminopimelate deacetylase